jgi:hypothetical protein
MNVLKEIARLNTLAEAKLVLLMMHNHNLTKGSLIELSDLTGLPVPEIAQGAHLLKVLGINKAKDFDSIVVDDIWMPRAMKKGEK